MISLISKFQNNFLFVALKNFEYRHVAPVLAIRHAKSSVLSDFSLLIVLLRSNSGYVDRFSFWIFVTVIITLGKNLHCKYCFFYPVNIYIYFF